jgi:hypothetical protein
LASGTLQMTMEVCFGAMKRRPGCPDERPALGPIPADDEGRVSIADRPCGAAQSGGPPSLAATSASGEAAFADVGRRTPPAQIPARLAPRCSPASSELSVGLTAPSRASPATASGLPGAAPWLAPRGDDGALPGSHAGGVCTCQGPRRRGVV